MKIGITCYPTYGGSGVVATELGKKFAQIGHEVHFISYALPYRLNRFTSNLFFHEVEVLKYPLFEYPPYSLSLASKMAEVIEYAGLDILHVHYAIPHATSAYLAREMMKKDQFRFITTLHGTDITLIGSDPSYIKIVKFSIEESDGITAVSGYLRQETVNTFNIVNPIEVIPNFIPDDFLETRVSRDIRACYAGEDELILTHISNFRPLKRVQDLVPVIENLVQNHKVKLLMVGDGPERYTVEKMCREHGLCEHIVFLGKQQNVKEVLGISDLFLFPSANESFGLAVLEALACGVPCITTNAGGLPEVNLDGQTGFTVDVGDIHNFTEKTKLLIEDAALRKRFSNTAKVASRDMYNADKIVPQYIDYYHKILAK